MRTIRHLQERDLDDYMEISLDAYPGIKIRSAAEKEQFRQRAIKMQADPIINLYGLFDQNKLHGIMRLYDFRMKLHETVTLVGGIGGVAVHLLHKKQKVAYEMMQFFLRHYQEKGACMTVLYPFRPDFYKQMGFGYGRKLDEYRIKPADLPSTGKRENVSFLSSRDKKAFAACYNNYLAQTNGLMEMFESSLAATFSASGMKMAGYWQDGKLDGYLVFQFEPIDERNFLRNRIVVRQIVFTNQQALHGLLAFLHAQADQIEEILLYTQEPDFHYLLHDPRNGIQPMMPPVVQQSNTQGLGIMYRVIDVLRLFTVLREHDFGGQTCHLRLNITDTFFPQNAGSYEVGFVNGRIQSSPNTTPQVEVSLDVADFSSLIVGAVEFNQLYRLGCVQISDASYVETLQKLFYTDKKPMCMTSF